MKTSKSFNLLLGAVIIVSIALTLYFYTANNKKREELVKARRSLEMHKNLLLDYQLIKQYGLMVGLDSLNNISVTNNNKQEYNLYDLINGKTPILYIENGMCEECVRKELNNLEAIAKIIGRENIILIANGYSSRYLYNSDVFKKWTSNLFQSEENPTLFNENLSGTPSIFIVDNNYIIRGAYHALKGTNKNFDIFLSAIRKTFN